jgi:hypothetical protein
MLSSILEITKASAQFSNSTPKSASKGLSSGHLEVFKTDSELCLRPGSPNRYNFISGEAAIAPSNNFSSDKDSVVECFFEEIEDREEIRQNFSLMLEGESKSVVDGGNSFFSNENEGRVIAFGRENEEKQKNDSFSSTKSKTERVNQMQKWKNEMRTYKNTCRIFCNACNEFIVTDLKISYYYPSL